LSLPPNFHPDQIIQRLDCMKPLDCLSASKDLLVVDQWWFY